MTKELGISAYSVSASIRRFAFILIRCNLVCVCCAILCMNLQKLSTDVSKLNQSDFTIKSLTFRGPLKEKTIKLWPDKGETKLVKQALVLANTKGYR